jgi:FkbM family methyltransferase
MLAAAELYRKIVPSAVRQPLWLARLAVTRRVIEGDREGSRGALADLLVWCGRPLARVSVGRDLLHVDLRDAGVGRPLFVRGAYEPLETTFLRNLLKPGMVFVDIGANIGYFTLVAARRVGPTGRVLAVEPEPYNFQLLQRNVGVNDLANVELANVALGDRQGSAALYCSPQNFGDHRLYDGASEQRRATEVQVRTLDGLVKARQLGAVDVIKMDVQGYENRVIAGMASTLAASPRALVLTEFWPYGIRQAGEDPQEFFALFARAGFAAFTLTSDGPGGAVDYGEAMRSLPVVDARYPDAAYINLIFCRPQRQ